MSCPMPNQKLNGATVVASCYYRDLTKQDKQYLPNDDDWPDTVYLVLLLEEKSPYFKIAHIADNGFQSWLMLTEHSEFNIVPAVQYYQQNGGDF